MRTFFRYYFFKTLMVLVAVQLLIFAWLQYRNHRPVAIADSAEVYAGQSIEIKPVRNDLDKDLDDTLSLMDVENPRIGEIDVTENLITYSTSQQMAGRDSFRYKISDGDKESKYVYIAIDVLENLPPNAKADNIQIWAGTTVQFNPLANDSDRENDSIYISDYSLPYHGSLERNGDLFSYTPQSMVKADSFQYSVSDGNSNAETTVNIEIKSKSDVCYPWLSTDVGNTTIRGQLDCSNNTSNISASGSDIWGHSDSFHYAYQLIEGNFELSAKVNSLDNINEWAKAGIMIRESLHSNSKNAYICVTTQHGVNSQVRYENNTGTISLSGNEINMPCWLKLKRMKDKVLLYASDDGKEWIATGEAELNVKNKVYIGLAVTSHDNNQTGSAQFSNIQLKE